ncbi:PTS glucose transporter subunit IIA [Nanchangia anserum]|uniref:PTS glucose transporter subunit IIA n=1 Tax=Nanchangia anserum TaxID=2692125 RepID=A0A8I0G8M9_9ACTO|nr:glucose PTS transporter subunit IIA [Nanchangia anserum]MBD3689912.1 PTS glucose transporter subunit IIA [Nanchangia anserum]QOX82271.1 PTS glucose transporter subunit IIA [Nanchangia anserum]
MATTTASGIIDNVGGPANIAHLTHCATRLRFQLHDASKVNTEALDALPGVMGTVPQSGERFQIIIGGAVQSVYDEIMGLPEMATAGKLSDDDVKAQARSKGPRGKFSWLDNFFEFLSDSFRPIIGALLGASLFITVMALMGTLGIIGNWADPRVDLPPQWAFVNLCWKCVFTFLPLLVAYNASKKVGADPWVGFAIMAALMLPGFSAFSEAARDVHFMGQTIKVIDIAGLPLTIFDYSSQVFPPLLMAALLGPLTKLLKKIFPANIQLIFVPFFSMLIMIPLTAFIIGPIGVYVGAALAQFLSAINGFSPLIFAIVIPLAYPFMVPLGLHWPINAIMLLNIQQLGYDYIQGPMGCWNFACFGATAGVLILSARNKDKTMRQTATGALAAGLLGGISEPSLYGIHLRFKRIYPSMLPGCLVGGLIIGLGGGVTTKAFVFTSFLTIPAFDSVGLYGVAVLASFITACVLVVIRGYKDKEEPVAVAASTASDTAEVASAEAPVAAVGAADTNEPAEVDVAQTTEAEIVQITAPLAGRLVALSNVPDPVFARGTMGEGVAIEPSSSTVVAPAAGKVMLAAETGHAVALKLAGGVELLIHVGLDTVKMGGDGFEVHVKAGDRVNAGDPLVTFDLDKIAAAGYPSITPIIVMKSKKIAKVTQTASGEVTPDTVILAAEKALQPASSAN